MASAPTVLLCHATGFHARCWDQVIRHLPESWTVLAPDLPGHGRTPKPAGALEPRWKDFGEAVAALTRERSAASWLAAGHSMGGHSLVHAAFLEPRAFRSLLLLDPVIRPAGQYGGKWIEQHFARKRRNEWQSPEEMFQRFHRRGPFAAWRDEVLRDYCDFALGSDGSLACDPQWEGAIYENSSVPASDISAELSAVRIPVVIARANVEPVAGEIDMNASPCDPQLASRFPRATDVLTPYGHFMPMEAPEWVASQIVALDQVERQ